MRTLRRGLLLASFVLGLPNGAQAALIHSYSFSGNAADETGSANGTVYNATLTTDRFGNANSAYSFDGNDAIQANFSSPSTASFAFWASWNGTETTMLFNSGPNGSGPDLFLYAGALSWNTWDSAANPFVDIADTDIGDGDFHHYTVVNDAINNLTSLFIDGALVGTAGYRYTANTQFTIGAASSTGEYGWQGVIDDVQIYDTALSGAEIGALAGVGAAVPLPSPLVLIAFGLYGAIGGRRHLLHPIPDLLLWRYRA